MTPQEHLARELAAARARTLLLTDHDEPELLRQHTPLLSPLVWDLAHVGQQEDLWLLRGGNAACRGLLPPDVEALYDAFTHPRAGRARLPLLPPVEARAFCAEVRGRVLDRLERLGRDDDGDPFPFAMVVSHEQQHDETMLQALGVRAGPPLLGAGGPLPPGRPGVAGTAVTVPGGEFLLGVDAADEPFSLDNERPAHRVHVPAFRIGRVPVTNAEYAAFVADGGYDQRRWWSPRGWAHRVEAGLERPQFWGTDGTRTRFGVVEELPPDEPVQHVTAFEAEAYAAWAGGTGAVPAGARLPTEVEWEKAAVWDPATGRRRRFPWGDSEPTPALANLGGAALRPAPVGAYPAGASPCGAEQLMGDVWEWTSSPFEPWPGFVPMLYADYSAPFFGGDHRVLRGGSWVVGPSILRPSFRNWDHPYRRQVFAGFRLAWSVDEPGA
ncbi:ergothioneine biosynthesis protein EgtB [Geodermatophilus sp. SYSU D00758]